jgi:nucleotide-binding universal stress UspA family protein
MSTTPAIRRILVPHDFSETAEHALSYAIGLAHKLGAAITLVHAFDTPSYGYPDSFVAHHDVARQFERAAVESLELIAARVREQGLPVETVLWRGAPWVEIAALAEQIRADVIVMGTHGRRGIAHALLGSVAEKVVRVAPCPVMTVRSPRAPRKTPTSVIEPSRVQP